MGKTSIRILRRVAASLVVLAVVLGACYVSLDIYFDKKLEKKRGGPVVVGLPQNIDDHQPIPPYTGKHPSLLNRPVDPFHYPIALGEVGPVEHLFAGPKEYPFWCRTEKSGLGQPMVDNQEGVGIPVFELDDQGKKTSKIIGYSKDCLIPTQAFYFYKRVGSKYFYPLEKANNDIEKAYVNGKEVDFVVRMEVGTIDRFIYAIIALKGENGSLQKPDTSNWNKRLIYQFRGGVGIGKRQGKMRLTSIVERRADLLKKGYAVAYSSGNRTTNHYNMWLAEELVTRVKSQFEALYGKPELTVGIGGSGGAIQQLLISQNHPGLLDGAVALYAFPDMLSQTIYAYDCDLLEYYFDVTDSANTKWRTWENRSLIEGLNAVTGGETKLGKYYDLGRFINGQWPFWSNGMTECVNGWRGLIQLTNNPKFVHYYNHYSQDILAKVHWTHWDNLKQFYGTGKTGYANSTWDNVGVQYGLQSLKSGEISVDEFLNINASVGGWKPAREFKQERYWKIVPGTSLFEMSPWSDHNMLHGDRENPAKRTQGSIEAIRAAYLSGHIFLGRLDIPVIDLRHYLDDELDMHHLSASFSIRNRMERAQGHRQNHIMWVSQKPYHPVVDAVELLSQWIEDRKNSESGDLVDSKPSSATDRCYDSNGSIIAEGDNVWDGEWNGKPKGKCLEAYPAYKNSRWVAGASIEGDIFKCHLQPVASAIEKGLYGSIDMEPYKRELEKIFPDGVCDYSKPSLGMPDLKTLGLPLNARVAKAEDVP